MKNKNEQDIFVRTWPVPSLNVIKDIFGTNFTKPCFKCGKMPAVGNVWRVERYGDCEREGHSECFIDSEV